MKWSHPQSGFRLEIRLGVAVIILVLTVLNVASYYALYRIGHSLEGDIRDNLAESCLTVSGLVRHHGLYNIPAGEINNISDRYYLSGLTVIPLIYERVMTLQSERALDSAFFDFDSTLVAADLRDILFSRPVYRQPESEEKYQVYFPMEYMGAKYLVAAAADSGMLTAIKKSMRVLVWSSLLVALVIAAVLVRLLRNVLRPFQKLTEKVRQSGHYQYRGDDEIAGLINSYEKVIGDLREKEKKLTELNELITRKADRLEVYNNHILRSIETGIITLDIQGHLASINQAAAGFLHVDGVAALGQGGRGLFEKYPPLWEIVRECLQTGRRPRNREIQVKDGGRRCVWSISISVLFDSQEAPLGVAVIINDQTEYARLKEELENSRRLAILGEMSGGLAHQLRNAVMAIIGFARLIIRKLESPHPARENAEALIREALQSEQLVTRFLDYARPLHMSPGSLEAGSLLQDVVNSVKSRYPHIDIGLEYDGARSEGIFIGDELLLKQALGNILDNACQAYDGRAGRVEVAARNEAGHIKFMIRDRGKGIAPEIRDRIFTPFFSGNPSGSGLGLSLAEKIVGIHGGKVSFESEPGRGTEFLISIPIATGVNAVIS